MRQLLLLTAAALCARALAATALAATATAPKPHIFIFVVDDFGWANIGIHRTPSDDPHKEVQTPAMDALAADGILLERNYAFWYCSPSRSSLQTGRNPIHVNLNNDDMSLMNAAEPTTGGYQGIPRNMTGIAWKMQEAGYQTAFFGKWHVGLATPDHTPAGRGWQQHMIYFDGANDYWTSESGSCGRGRNATPITDLWKDGAPARGINSSWACSQSYHPETLCTFEDTFFVNETLTSIASRDTSKPFFEVWAPHSIHAPLQVPTPYLTKFSFIKDARRQAYAAKVNYIDDQLATIVAAIKGAGMWEDMLFILTSDNGGPIYDDGAAGANNWPLRGGKTSNHEGGIRVNGIVSGGLLPAAQRGTTTAALISIADWYATACALAGVDTFDARGAAAGLPPVDSINLWPLLSGSNSTPPRTEIFFGIPTISSANSIGDPHLGVQAIVQAASGSTDIYKLIIGVTHQNVWTSPMYPNASTAWPNSPYDCGDSGCLYNIAVDPTEHEDVAGQHPAIASALRERIRAANATVYRPDRGMSSPLACEAALGKWGGFWGPFAP